MFIGKSIYEGAGLSRNLICHFKNRRNNCPKTVRIAQAAIMDLHYVQRAPFHSNVTRRVLQHSSNPLSSVQNNTAVKVTNKPEKSSVFHNHIDAESHDLLKRIISEIEEESPDFHNKIYHVNYLVLGPQVRDPEFKSVYRHLPNFHTIYNASDEAFSTGKMEDKSFNYRQTNKTLKKASQYSNKGVMTELEEEVFAMTINKNNVATITLDRGNTPYVIDWTQLGGWKERQIANIPKFELHHGIDIAKLPGEEKLPINVVMLSSMTSLEGFNTGGWFVFKKSDRWAYRSNEFSNRSYRECMDTLERQAIKLRAIASTFLGNREFESSASLEKVHAMWRF